MQKSAFKNYGYECKLSAFKLAMVTREADYQ